MAEFKLGRLRFVWKGAWSAAVQYSKDDIVRYGGSTYVSLVGHTSTSSFPTDQTANKWQLMSEGIEWVSDPWQPNTAYKQNDIVKYGGSTYISEENHTSDIEEFGGFDTDLAANKWTLLIEGQVWQGEWQANTYYKVGDLVKYGSFVYLCNTGHRSTTDVLEGLEVDLAKWDLKNEGVRWRYGWSANTRYIENDIVKYGANNWICVNFHTSGLAFEQTNWTLFTSGLEFENIWNTNDEYQEGDIVVYGGYSYISVQQGTNRIPPLSPSFWAVLTKGFEPAGEYQSLLPYKVGSVVSYGGFSFVSKEEIAPNESPALAPSKWAVISKGIKWRGDWSTTPEDGFYKVGDAIKYLASSYICVAQHVPLDDPNPDANRPDLDTTGTFWNVLAEGDDQNTLLRRGDLLTRNAVQNIRLPLGDPGTFLKAGEEDLSWERIGVITRIFYVSTDGEDLPENGTTLDSPWRTIKYACDYVRTQVVPTVTQPAVINIKTGVYNEIFPISVPKFTSLVGDELRMSIIEPTPETSHLDKFYLRDSTTLRNFTFRGGTGAPGTNGFTVPNQYGTRRPTGGAWCSLDPGTGPNDESVWVGQRSPYMQNITLFGDYTTGQKIDGSLHNGGNKSIVSNDFTTILSNGIGAWCANQGRAELVSVFTYYSYIGYLCETGGVIRATNGNNSYGTFGSVSEGVDPTEISRTASVDNRRFPAIVDRVQTNGESIIYLEYLYPGEEYTTAQYGFAGSGSPNSVVTTPNFKDGGVAEIKVVDDGDGYSAATSNLITGDLVSVQISPSDGALTGAYNGMRIAIVDGAGAGQYGIINNFDGGTKTLNVLIESQPATRIVATQITTNQITSEGPITVEEDQQVMVLGTPFGGLTNTTIYYVLALTGPNTFTLSETLGGPAVSLFNAVGDAEIRLVGWDVFNDERTVDVSAITNTSPVKVTTSTPHGLADRFSAFFENVGGTTQLNGNTYYVQRVSSTEFNLFSNQNLITPVDGTAFGVFTTGGTVIGFLDPLPVLDTTSRYYIEPRPVFSTGTGASATANRTLGVVSVQLTSGGSGYTNIPQVLISNPDLVESNENAIATATISGPVLDVLIQSKGTAFTSANPTLTVVGGGLPANNIAWAEELVVTLDDTIITSAERIYRVTVAGTLGTTEPSHTNGTDSNGSASLQYLGRRASITATTTNSIRTVTLQSGGLGYNSPPTVTAVGSGSDAVISSRISQVISEINIITGGANYTSPPSVLIAGGEPVEFAQAISVLDASISNIVINEGGNGYTSANVNVQIVGDGEGAVVEAILDFGSFEEGVTPGIITGFNIVNPGSGFTVPPLVVITGSGSGARATAQISGSVSEIVLTNRGRGYNAVPNVSFIGGGGAGATATAVVTGSVVEVSVVDGGRGWAEVPTLEFSGGGGNGAAAAVTAMHFVIDQVTVQDGGDNYTSNPAIAVAGGQGAILRPRINGVVNNVSIVDPGSEYTQPAIVSFIGGGNYKSPVAGLRYYLNASGLVAIGNTQGEQTLAAINRIRDVLKAVANNTNPSTLYQTASVRVPGDVSYVPPVGIDEAIDIWIDSIYFTIENTQNMINAKALLDLNRKFIKKQTRKFIDLSFSGVADDTWNRDFGLVVDAVASDLGSRGVNHTVTAGLRQIFLVARTDENDLIAAVESLNYMSDLFKDIVQNIIVTPILDIPQIWRGIWAVTTSYNVNDVVAANNKTYICLESHISSATFEIDLDLDRWEVLEDGQRTQDIAFESESIVAIGNNLNLLVSLISNSSGSASFADAASLIKENTTFIKAETIAFVNNEYTDFTYNQVLCARDTGFIVDAVAFDVEKSNGDLEPVATGATAGVIGSLTVVDGGDGYSSGVSIQIGGGNPQIVATAVPVIDSATGAITAFTMINKGRNYDTSPVTVNIVPDTGFGTVARCRLAGSNVSKVVIIKPGQDYTSGPFMKLIDAGNTIRAQFEIRVGDGVLDQPTFLDRGSDWLTADATINGDGYADVTQTGSFIYVKDLTNLPTPGANIQFEGNDTFYKLVEVREPVGPQGLLSARQLLLSNKAFIQQEVASYIFNFTYDSVKCSRDVGLIIDAIAQDVVYESNAKSLAAIHQYRRNIYADFENQRFQTAFALEYLKQLMSQSQKPATLAALSFLKTEAIDSLGATPPVSAVQSVANNSDIIIEILDEGLTAVPAFVTPDPTGYNIGFFNARRLLLLNRNFLIQDVVGFVNLTYPSVVYDEEICARDLGYIIDALQYDLTYGGNLMTLLAARSYFSYSTLQIDSNDLTATIGGFNRLRTILASVLQGILVSPEYATATQNTSGTAGSSDAADFAQDRLDEVIAIVGETGAPTEILPDLAWVDAGLVSARNSLIAAKTTIQDDVIDFIEANFPTLVFNRTTCSRDVGYIIDSLGFDLMFQSNFQSIKAGMSYYRAGANTVLNGIATKLGNLDTIIEFIKNGEYFKNIPIISIPDGNGTADANNAKDIILANLDFLAGNTRQSFINNYPAITVDPDLIELEFKQLLSSVAHDLAFTGNSETVRFAESFYLNGNTFILPGYIGVALDIRSNYQSTVEFLKTIVQNILQNIVISPESGLEPEYSQNISLPAATNAISTADGLFNNFNTIIGTGPGTVTVVPNTFVGYDQQLTGTKEAIDSSKTNLRTAVTNWINDEFVNFDGDLELTLRDTGLIVQAIADDVFGDVAKSIEAGQRFYAPSAQVLRDTILPQTIASIDRINIIAQKVIRNETYIRTQNLAFQERFPALILGEEASEVLSDRIIIIRRILEVGDVFQGIRQVLLDNKEYIKAEVIAYINASYENLDYSQELCARDVGLIIDAFIFDIFGGFSRSREAGLRYYASASGLKAITEQNIPTVDAIEYLTGVIKNVLQNLPPDISFQEVLQRTPVNSSEYEVTELINLGILEKIEQCRDELLNVIEVGPTALPPGRYSARLQISPPLTVLTSPEHSAPTTIRSKYSQVRLTGHDFLNIGTGDKNESNYPGIPINLPNQLQEIREVGGGRVFYTSTDQDGNFRVGELFRVEQSTGIATLNADAFNLSGLNELSLGGITLGGTNAVIREFSTDPTFFANSDSVVPTQRAIRSYIQAALGSGGGSISVNALIAGSTVVTGDELTTIGDIPFRFTTLGGIKFQAGIESIDPTTGSIVVLGGVGIQGNLNVTGTATANFGTVTAGSIESTPIGETSASTAKFTDLTATNSVLVEAGTSSDSTIEGALVVVGGVGVGGNLNVGGNLSTSGLTANSIDSTPIGSILRSSGAFTTLAANSTVSLTANEAATTTGTGTLRVTGGIGATGALVLGGNLTVSGSNATITMSPTGTGSVTINPAGAVSISPNGAVTLNPGSAGTINNMSIGATTASTGRFTTVTSTVATGTAPFTVTSTTRVSNLNVATAGTADQLTTSRNINGVAFNGTSDITITASPPNASTQLLSLGVGTSASGTTGEIRATSNITAYFSDQRLKENIEEIDNALEKLKTLSGVYFNSNDRAAEFGYTDKKRQVGVIAQQVEQVLPEIVVAAPFDIGVDSEGKDYSLSGDNYKTVHYEKMIPLLIQAIKEQQNIIDELRKKVGI
jgi:hypothetical protein